MLLKTRSRNLIPNIPKTPLWKKKRKPLNRKRTFKAQNDQTKTYLSKRRPEHVCAYAEQCRQERFANPTEAEEAFAAIMDELGIEYERERIFYYAGGQKFCISDFTIEVGSQKLIIEIDGSSHASQSGYDRERDIYFTGLGWKTLRLSNKECLKTPGAVAEKVRREVDGHES